ncbi:GTP-binding protein [Paenibacillus rhizosphaerae]|uniref:GTP-binding protein n=1 Tax=Paenibacillus rhizosphaerae TaxID=297318 RepID=UPI00142E403B
MDHIFSDLRPIVRSVPAVQRKTFKVIESVRRQQNSQGEHSHHENDHLENKSFSRVQTIALHFAEGASTTAKQIDRFLKQWGKSLLPAKGYLVLVDQTCKLVQFAGNRIVWQPTGYPGPSYLVLIGIDLDRDRVNHEWAKIVSYST